MLSSQLAVLDMKRFAANVVPSPFRFVPPHFRVAELTGLWLSVFLVYFAEMGRHNYHLG